jgi:hypothetical protein
MHLMQRHYAITVCIILMSLTVHGRIPFSREVSDTLPLPENTPVARFFKYAFSRLDESDVKSLALVMKEAYANLCKEIRGGRERAEMELEDLHMRRYSDLEINMAKMRKLGMIFQRMIAAGSRENNPI